jgi:hypothetical protein
VSLGSWPPLFGGSCQLQALPTPSAMRIPCDINLSGASIMGKYVLGWFMGVPIVVLVIIYLIFN